MRPQQASAGPYSSANATAIALPQRPLTANASLTLTGNPVTDSGGAARRIIFTTLGNEVGNFATITGFGLGNQALTEVVALGGVGAVVGSALDYVSVTRIVITNAAAANISVGTTAGTAAVLTNPIGSSQWIRFDGFAGPNISIQCKVVGAGSIGYVLQITNDDPNSENYPVPASSMVWSLSPDPAVGTPGTPAAATLFTSLSFIPVFARILVENVGSTTVGVVMTAQQSGVAPY